MGHWYTSPQGRRLPSVTTILEATMSDESRFALDQWQAKGLRSYLITEQSIQRGNSIDAWAKAYLLSSPLPQVPFKFLPYLVKLRSLLDQLLRSGSQIKPDVVLASDRLGFAGTADLVLVNRECFTILDFKTRDYPSPIALERAFIQCAGYAELYADVFGESLFSLAVITAMPSKSKLDQMQGVNLVRYLDLWRQRARAYGITSLQADRL